MSYTPELNNDDEDLALLGKNANIDDIDIEDSIQFTVLKKLDSISISRNDDYAIKKNYTHSMNSYQKIP